MKDGEEKGKREMGEIMPMNPSIPTVIEDGAQPALLPFPFTNLATTESVMEAIKLLLEENPDGVRKADVYCLLRPDEAPINVRSKRGATKVTNPLYSLICKTMDKLTKEEHLLKTESGFGGVFTINQPPAQPIITSLSLTLFNVDKRHRLIRKLNREGKSVEEIVDIVSVSRSTVNKVLNKTKPNPKLKPEAKLKTAGTPPPTEVLPPVDVAEALRRKRPPRQTIAKYKERVARIKELHETGKTTGEIRAEIGCSKTTVNRIVQKFHQGSPLPPRGRGNYGPKKYPPPAPPPVLIVPPNEPSPALWHNRPLQKRPVGRPRKDTLTNFTVTLHRPKGFWGWIIRFAERMMIRRSQRRAQKAAKMLGVTPEVIQALIKRGPAHNARGEA